MMLALSVMVIARLLDTGKKKKEELKREICLYSKWGRSTVLDCVVRDSRGRQINMEIQQEKEGTSPKRTRFWQTECGN